MDVRLQSLLWVIASVVIGVVALVAVRARGEDFWHATTLGGLTAEIALFLYQVGLPFLALIAGSVSLDLLGLGIDWFREDHLLGFTLREWLEGSAFTAGAVVFVIGVLAFTRAPNPTSITPESGLLALRNAIYDEAHWALYRSPFVLLLGDGMFGALAGLALVLIEHGVRQRVAPHQISRGRWLLLVLGLLTSALLFVLTQNLWLMIAANTLIRVTGQRLLNRPDRLRQTAHATE
jgi:ABC-type antimicrobial peptide transport system permease subunit